MTFHMQVFLCAIFFVHLCSVQCINPEPTPLPTFRSGHNAGKQYRYDEIVQAMRDVTHQFLLDLARLHNFKYDLVPGEIEDPSFRVKRSLIENQHVPSYLRDGIWPLSAITDSGSMCQNQRIIDVYALSFNDRQFVLCLVLKPDSRFALHYGARHQGIFVEEAKVDIPLDNPKKILAFAHHNSGFQDLIVLVLNKKQRVEQNDVIWFRINTRLEVTHRNYLKLNQLLPDTSVVWPDQSIVIFHDNGDNKLKVFKYVGTYFDLQLNSTVSKDLHWLCPYTYKGISYLAFGYSSFNFKDSTPKDVQLASYNVFDHKLDQRQSLQVHEDILQVQYFTIGHSKQSIFLALVQSKYIVFYKFLNFALEFRIFQRISVENVRKVVSYGDVDNLFVMAIISHTNDVTLITYNSFRFLVSNVQRRIFILPPNPVILHRFAEKPYTVTMLVGTANGVKSYDFTFVHDTSLLQQWHNNMEWCWTQRDETLVLEHRTNIVEKRYSEAFLKTEPFTIDGTLSVNSYNGTVSTGGYQSRNYQIDPEYFAKLQEMQTNLDKIDRKIHQGYHRLNDALQVQTTEIQRVTGDYVFQNMKILNYHSEGNSEMINLKTNTLNAHSVRGLEQDTVRLAGNGQVAFLRPLKFERILQNSAHLQVNSLVNDAFNLSELVTSSGSHHISGRKRFVNVLMVDENISAGKVNGKNFTHNTVLLTNIEQEVKNPVMMQAKMIRTSVLNARMVNGKDLNTFLGSIVRKDERAQITSPVQFANGLELYDLLVEGPSTLNGHNIDDLLSEVVWTNKDNQTIWSEFIVGSNLTVNGNLFAERINGKSIPHDLVLANQLNLIKGEKRFESLTINRLNVVRSINGIDVVKGMPDILLKFTPQNITGAKSISSVHISNHSFVRGLINGLSLQELKQKSEERPQTRRYDRLYVENFANFVAGLHFGQFNSLSRSQFDQLMQHSVGLDQPWDFLHLGDVTFDSLSVNILDCNRVNSLNLDSDLLTRNSSQTITGPFTFNQLFLEQPSYIKSVNNFSLKRLENVFRTYGDQHFELKIFGNRINVRSLKVNSINGIETSDIVFMDEFESKTITGTKHFQGQSVQFDYLSADDLHIPSINSVSVQRLLGNTLQRYVAQNIPRHIQFKLLQLQPGQDFASGIMNGVNLAHLQNDLVWLNGVAFQNVSGQKSFLGPVNFESLTFKRLFDGVTGWEMSSNWMVQNMPQNVQANFSIDSIQVPRVFLHNDILNGIDLSALERTVVRLDQKTVIHTEFNFVGEVHLEDDIILNGKLNDIDLRKDVLYTKYHGIQTFRGNVRLLGNVFVYGKFDVNGQINHVNVRQMCASAYVPKPNEPLVINGNVRISVPARIDMINNISYSELRDQVIRHDVPQQTVTANLVMDTLVLNNHAQLRQTINNVYLEPIFRDYMSKTKQQVINCDIVLQSDQVFTDEVVVKNFFVETAIVDNVNLSLIDETALRVYGNQYYPGNIEFNADVIIDLNLNTKWINGVNTNYFMRKRTDRQTFLEEVSFTSDFTVRDSLIIVNHRQISGVDIGMMLQNAVQRDSAQNYTIRGVKTFDSMHVQTIHAKRNVSKVKITKQNLLLRTDKQTITGQISFVGNVVVNSSVVNEINNVKINEFYNGIAKKSAQNVIHSPVRFAALNVSKAEVRALIDNVDISIFNTIAHTVERLETLKNFSTRSQRQFESFQKQLNLVLSKFLFYERYLSVYASTLAVRQLETPLMVTSMSQHLAIVLPGKQSECSELNVYLKKENDAQPWDNLKLYSPFSVISVHQADDFLIVSSTSTSTPAVSKCLSKNKLDHSVKIESIQEEGILFQVYRIMATMHTSMLMQQIHYKKPSPRAQVLQLSPNHMAVCSVDRCTLICLHRSCGKLGELSTVPLSGNIRKVYNYRETLLVSTQNQLVTILKMQNNALAIVQSIAILNAKLMLLVQNGNGFYENKHFVLIADGKKSQLIPLIHVYATKDGTHYHKVQEISENIVYSMDVFYAKPNEMEPYVLLQREEEIVIYQLIPTGGFQRYSQIKSGENVQWLRVTNRNYLALYYANGCHTTEPGVNPYIELLRPRFRQEISYGTETLVQNQTTSGNVIYSD